MVVNFRLTTYLLVMFADHTSAPSGFCNTKPLLEANSKVALALTGLLGLADHTTCGPKYVSSPAVVFVIVIIKNESGKEKTVTRLIITDEATTATIYQTVNLGYCYIYTDKYASRN